MKTNLYDHQRIALEKLGTGSILCGGVGSGKSLTALGYFFEKECGGQLESKDEEYKDIKKPKNLYIITTARKRDTYEWDKETADFSLIRNDATNSYYNILLVVDSWNNIKKYVDIENAFFIFDEQRVVGSGAWVKSFLKITKKNNWILLTATPGDTWMDYVPVFIANGFYKNRTEFILRHVIYSRFAKFPKVEKYIDTWHLIEFKKKILVMMDYEKKTRSHRLNITTQYDKKLYDTVFKKRWDPYNNRPVKDAGSLCYLLRRVVNSDPSRLDNIKRIIEKHKKIIVFYNFNYELEILKTLKDTVIAEYNGHKHEAIPNSDSWVYFVQYMSGAEGWNCIETNTIVFYSENYSYKMMKQAAGRIDRLNTPYIDLFYYHMYSESSIDFAISKALKEKKNFNETSFLKGE